MVAKKRKKNVWQSFKQEDRTNDNERSPCDICQTLLRLTLEQETNPNAKRVGQHGKGDSRTLQARRGRLVIKSSEKTGAIKLIAGRILNRIGWNKNGDIAPSREETVRMLIRRGNNKKSRTWIEKVQKGLPRSGINDDRESKMVTHNRQNCSAILTV
ncbi:unnamed protein product [Nesidiocoris tenuis]|uniref:Uncharacterized protein n=1 Tax=Nesidiocoris tenuis TaxID=355587 RepID=A0A6H5H4X5_9HEMI|nr:unnamed protein product [Nesidiocoris tenuis]